jgi:hypothetical protein
MTLRWTSAGAVASPTSVQIRVAPDFSGRIAAGAPQPSRAMTVEEVASNLEWFARARVGPRAAACTRAVLSGIEDLDGWEQVIPLARSLGVVDLTVHGAPVAGADVDRWVVVASAPGDVRPGVDVVVPLERASLVAVGAIVERSIALCVGRIVLTWPFPSEDRALPPTPAQAIAAVIEPVASARAAGIPIAIKGFPACLLRDLPDGRALASRTRNRWYVDADHQRDDALLFFPDILRFSRPDACRQCVLAAQCDGVAERWLALGLIGPLEPFAR